MYANNIDLFSFPRYPDCPSIDQTRHLVIEERGAGQGGVELTDYVDIVPSLPATKLKKLNVNLDRLVRSLTLLPQIYMKPYCLPHPSQQPLRHTHKPLSPAFFRIEQLVRTGNDRARSQECVETVESMQTRHAVRSIWTFKLSESHWGESKNYDSKGEVDKTRLLCRL